MIELDPNNLNKKSHHMISMCLLFVPSHARNHHDNSYATKMQQEMDAKASGFQNMNEAFQNMNAELLVLKVIITGL